MLGPIFIREWLTVPRRPRHYLTRALFLGALWVLLLTVWQTTVGWDRPPTLGDTARFGLLAFQILTYVQLACCSSSPPCPPPAPSRRRRTAAPSCCCCSPTCAITRSSWASCSAASCKSASCWPARCRCCAAAAAGRHRAGKSVQAIVVLATTAVAAGSLGGLIALWRDKTFQALALTVLFLVLYLCLTRASCSCRCCFGVPAGDGRSCGSRL